MNKRILIAAILSIIIQLILVYAHIPYAVMFAVVFYIIAIPFVLYHLFKNGKSGVTAANSIGTLLTFPLLLIWMMIAYSESTYPSEEIDPETIEFYNEQGKSIPKDSLLQRLEQDSTAVERVSFGEETE
jgi:hypothetical protein